MELIENEKILTTKELRSAVWEKKRQKVLKGAEETDLEYGTEKAEAQEQLQNFILNLGGVREDVYTYLLTPRFRQASSILAIKTLLCYAAPVAWVELTVKALDRDAITGLLYADEITEAYKEGIPLEIVQDFFSQSKTAFEMCQRRIRCKWAVKKERPCDTVTQSEEEKLRDTMAQSEEEKLRDTMAQSKEEKPRDTVAQSEKLCSAMSQKRKSASDNSGEQMTEIITEAVMTAVQKFFDNAQEGGKSYDSVTQSDEKKLHDTMAQNEKEKLYDTMAQSDEKKLHDTVAQSEEERLCDTMARSKKERTLQRQTEGEKKFYDSIQQSMEDMPDFPDGEELLDNGMLVVSLEKEEEQYEKRVSFFQLLLNRHMKKAFSKLDEETQVSRIFEIMVGQKYGKRKILAVRRLMNGGMSKEFIYSLLERDLSEEELTELCSSLLDEAVADSGEAPENAAESEQNLEHKNRENDE